MKVLLGYAIDEDSFPIIVNVEDLPVSVPEGQQLELGWGGYDASYKVEPFEGDEQQIREKLAEVRYSLLTSFIEDLEKQDGVYPEDIQYFVQMREGEDRDDYKKWLDQFFSTGNVPWNKGFANSVYVKIWER